MNTADQQKCLSILTATITAQPVDWQVIKESCMTNVQSKALKLWGFLLWTIIVAGVTFAYVPVDPEQPNNRLIAGAMLWFTPFLFTRVIPAFFLLTRLRRITLAKKSRATGSTQPKSTND